MHSMGYLARAVVNNVLKGGELTSDFDQESDACKIS